MAFIMSVHIGWVLQILVCIYADAQFMWTPLQTLLLILVTDLSPTRAVGRENAVGPTIAAETTSDADMDVTKHDRERPQPHPHHYNTSSL